MYYRDWTSCNCFSYILQDIYSISPNIESNITSHTTEEPWITVNRGHKKPPSVYHASYHQIPVILNQCDLTSKKENYELMACESMGTHELKVKNESRDKVQGAKNKHMEKKHKIIVTGDSHARGCEAEIKLNLNEGFKVKGLVNPGSGVNTITTSAKIDIQHLSKQDVVVVWGGSKDIRKIETKTVINCIQRFVKTNNHTNFILMTSLIDMI